MYNGSNQSAGDTLNGRNTLIASLSACAIVATGLFVNAPAHSQTSAHFWRGQGGSTLAERQNWFNEANWTNGSPGTNSRAVINLSAPDGLGVLLEGGTADITDLRMGISGTELTSLTIGNSGILSISGLAELGRGGSGLSTLVLKDGGALNVGAEDGAGNRDGILVLGHLPGSPARLVIGSSNDLSPSAPGTLSAAEVSFRHGDATLLFNHTATESAAYEFDVDLATRRNGTHQIIHQAGHTTYSGNGSQFTGDFNLDGGTFVLTSELAAKNTYVSSESGRPASLVVSGPAAKLDIADTLSIGTSGSGHMLIENGGKISAGYGSSGEFQASSGMVTVTGAGSQLNLGSLFFIIGYRGAGILNIADGAEVNIADHSGDYVAGGFLGLGLLDNDPTMLGDESEGVLIIGAWPGQDPVGAGHLNAAQVRFGAGNASIIFNHDQIAEDNYTFDVDLAAGTPGQHEI